MLFPSPSLKLAQKRVEGQNIYLRMAQKSDYKAWRQLRESNQDFLQPFEPIWEKDCLSKSAFYTRIKQDKFCAQNDNRYAFLIFTKKDDQLVGGININNVSRGVFQCASLGYWMGQQFNGKGYMSEAVALTTQDCFTKWRLNRVQAATLTHNQASIRVLEKNGFKREGVAERYLKINGIWQDHFLFAKASPLKE